MTSIVLFLGLSALAILLLALPFLRREAAPEREVFDLNVYRDQLTELERDQERGLIDEEAARAARLEIERRILLVAEEGTSEKTPPQSRPTARLAAAAGLVMVVPIASALLYVALGKPEMRDLPLAARPAPDQQLEGRDSLLANIEQLEQHLETTPDNGGVWTVLGRTRMRAGLYQDAVEAFRKGVELTEDDPTVRAELAEAMVYAAGGQVTPASIDEFRTVLETVPNEPRARYYVGLALAQEGEVDAALDGWRQLLEASPSDAPWRANIMDAIRSVLQAEGRPVDEIMASLPEGTTATAAAATDAESGGGEVDNEQIRGMVEGLAARLEDEPDDVQGWLMLGRSRMVLEEPELAREAYERALALAPGDVDVLRAYAGSLLGAAHPETSAATVGEEAEALYRQIVEIAPEDPEAHWYLGLVAVQNGAVDEAKRHWRQVLDVLGPDHPNYAAVQSSLEEVETKTQ